MNSSFSTDYSLAILFLFCFYWVTVMFYVISSFCRNSYENKDCFLEFLSLFFECLFNSFYIILYPPRNFNNFRFIFVLFHHFSLLCRSHPFYPRKKR